MAIDTVVNPTRSELAEELAAQHADTPQRAALTDLALKSIYTGIDELASLGHTFELVRGSTQPVREFPKMMYHDDLAAGGREIDSQVEQDRLGLGWRDRPIAVPVEGNGKAEAEAGEGTKPPVTDAPPAQAGNKPAAKIADKT